STTATSRGRRARSASRATCCSARCGTTICGASALEEALLVRVHPGEVVLLERRRGQIAAIERLPQLPGLTCGPDEAHELLLEEALVAVRLRDERVGMRLDQHHRRARHDPGERGGMHPGAHAPSVGPIDPPP